MTKAIEKLLFETIEGAIEYGADRNRYGEFEFNKLYKKIESMEQTISKLKRSINK